MHVPGHPAALFVGSGGWRHGIAYGFLGLPLAFVALPLYVLLPNHYARAFGAPLAALGMVLLLARLFDAVLDPLIGRWCDRLAVRSSGALLAVAGCSGLILALGFGALFFPPPSVVTAGTGAILMWAGVSLVFTYTAYSVVAVAHQAWGARLGGTETQRSRVVAWREGAAVVGVLLAAVLPSLAGLGPTVAVFAVLLACGWVSWARSVAPPLGQTTLLNASFSPWAQGPFRRLMAVFLINGIASAIPATLVLFFVQDRLQAPPQLEPLFLLTYFACAAMSIPAWTWCVARFGLARSWRAGMLLSVGVFVWAATLGAGDLVPFFVVCALSGFAVGADLTMPSALLAGIVDDCGERGKREGAFFGWWNFAAKLNLALAAGLALPLLAWFGYTPGDRAPEGLVALTFAYCVLPCALKLLAAAALQYAIITPARRRSLTNEDPE